jgi:uncharacterized membrane protein
VVWIGSLSAISLIVIPSAKKSLDPLAYSALLLQVQTRLQPISWFSLAVLGVTGMFQMSSNPAYDGFMAVTNSWASAILLKHIVIGVMVLSSGAMTWGVLPGLQRTALLRASGQEVDEARQSQLERMESRLLLINLVLSAVVLALTAWARSV